MEKTEKQGVFKKYRLDIVVIAALLLVSLAVVLFVMLSREAGAYVEVEISGEIVGKYPLAVDGVYTLNGGTNVLTVENGSAYMSASTCDNHVCEKMGRVQYVGQTISCAPHFITVTVVGSPDTGVDFVS